MRSAILVVAGGASMAFAATTSVVNRCSFPIYLWSVPGNTTSSAMFTIQPGTGYKETQYLPMSNGAPHGAVSIKMTPTPEQVNPLQFEYNPLDTLWYDMSCVDGNSLRGTAFTLYPSGGQPAVSCKPVITTQSQESCYQYSTDDAPNMRSCWGQDTDLIFTICADGTDGSFDKSVLSKRDAEADAVCVGDDGIVGYCDTMQPVAVPTTAAPAPASSSPAPSPVAAVQAPAPVVALQKASSSSTPAPASSPAPAPAAAAPAKPQTNSLDAVSLKLASNSGITSWQTGPGELTLMKRDAEADAKPIVNVEEPYQAPARRRRHLHDHAKIKLSHSH